MWAWPLLFAVAALAGAGMTTSAASAASNGTFSIFPARTQAAGVRAPSYFDFSLKAGQSASDAFTLANDADHVEQFNLYPADAYDVTAGGGFALRGFGEKNIGVGSWIKLPPSVSGTFSVAANSQVTVPFTVSVPADASPGERAGGIVALGVTTSNNSKSKVHFSVRQGVGVRVYLHVLGPLHPSLAVENLATDVSVPPVAFVTGSSQAIVSFDVVNNGNTVYPSVSVRAYATNALGQRVRTFRPTHLATVLPGSRETITEPTWSPLPIAGPVTIHVQLVATGVNLKYTSSFWVVPWILVLLIVLVLLALVVLIVFVVRRRSRRRRAGKDSGTATTNTAGAEPAGAEAVEAFEER